MGAEVTAEKVAEITYTETKEIEKTVSHDDAQEIITHFEEKGYISASGKIKDSMKQELNAGTLDIPERFEAAREKFEAVISKANRPKARLGLAVCVMMNVVNSNADRCILRHLIMVWFSPTSLCGIGGSLR